MAAVSGLEPAYYTHDAAGRMSRVSRAAAPQCDYQYDAASNLTKKVFANGAYAYFTYDGAGRPIKIDHRNADHSSLVYLAYDYDPASRITAIARDEGLSIYYGYDGIDRLTSETWRDGAGAAIYAYQWDYDPVGNRTWQSFNGEHTYYDHDPANALARAHTVPSDDWTYWHYDSRGYCRRVHSLADGTQYFDYDHRLADRRRAENHEPADAHPAGHLLLDNSSHFLIIATCVSQW